MQERKGKNGSKIEEDTYRNINTNLPGLNVLCKLARRTAALGEDGDAVTVFIRVDDIDGFIERLGIKADEDGSEDFFFVARHVFRHVGNHRRSDLFGTSVSNSLIGELRVRNWANSQNSHLDTSPA